MQSVIITKNQSGQRLDKFLKKYLPEAENSFLYKMLRKKNITLNGKKAEGKEILSQDDQVCFFFSDETFQKFRGVSVSTEYQRAYQMLKGIEVLYEDEDILIVNKPSGILTQKATPKDLSLNEWLIGYLLKEKSISEHDLESFHPSVCNRLDRNTSGIVLCGKSLAGSQLLSRLIRERTLRKFYHTVCNGQVMKASVIEGYLVKDEASNKVKIMQQSNEESAYIKTGYCPLKVSGEYTMLEVELITGKTHQIRAHLASIGHAIIGDYKYGIRNKNNLLKQKTGLEAQLLHAFRVEFPDDDWLPESLRGLQITAPYSLKMKEILNFCFPK